MVESLLMSKGEPLTPDIDGVVALRVFGGPKIQKSAKIGLLNFTREIILAPLKSVFGKKQLKGLEADTFGWPTPIKICSGVAEKELPPIWHSPFRNQFLPNALWIKSLIVFFSPYDVKWPPSVIQGVISIMLQAFQSHQDPTQPWDLTQA